MKTSTSSSSTRSPSSKANSETIASSGAERGHLAAGVHQALDPLGRGRAGEQAGESGESGEAYASGAGGAQADSPAARSAPPAAPAAPAAPEPGSRISPCARSCSRTTRARSIASDLAVR